MTENERIAKVLGWEWSYTETPASDVGFGVTMPGGRDYHWRLPDGSRYPAEGDGAWVSAHKHAPEWTGCDDPSTFEHCTPDWPNDIGACFRDLVPHVFKRLREADLTWVDAVSMHAGGDGKWNCEFGYPAPDPEEEVEFEYAAAPTLAAAICAAFLAAFEVKP